MNGRGVDVWPGGGATGVLNVLNSLLCAVGTLLVTTLELGNVSEVNVFKLHSMLDNVLV